MNTETLKEYLVSIGWDIHESDYKHATDVISKFGSQIANKISPNVKTLGTAALFVLDVLKTGNKIILQTIDTVADLDYETEKLARQWWVSEEAVRSYSTALEALGETNEDLFTMTDEQYRRLVELNQIGRGLEAPKELDDFLLTVRDIKFEFAKLKVEIQYGLRWVTYFFAKLTGSDAKIIKEKLSSFNDKIQKNLPKIAEKIAEIFYTFYRLGKAVIEVGKVVFDLIKSIFDIFDNKLGKTALLVSSFFLLISSGPIGMFIAALTALLLLVEDFLGWKEGKISYFDWGAISDDINSIMSDFSDIKDDLKDILDFISDIFEKLHLEEAIIGIFKMGVSEIRSFTALIADDLDRISSAIDAVQSGDLSGLTDWSGVADWIKERTENLSDFYNNPLNPIGGPSNDLGKWFELGGRLFNFFSGSTDKYSAEASKASFNAGAISTMQSTSNVVNYGGVNVHVKSTEEANKFVTMLSQRDFAVPTI